MVEHNRVDFLCVTLQTVNKIAIGDLPHADSTIVGARDQSVPVGSDGAHRVMMARQRTNEVRIVVIIGGRRLVVKLGITRFGQLPHTESGVARSCDDDRLLGHDDRSTVRLCTDLHRLQDDQAADRRGMSLESV